MLKVKNWQAYQHYRDRSPPWIKLHKGLLDNFEFQCLPVASRALAPMIWLLASEQIDGALSDDLTKIAFRLRMRIEDVKIALEPLIHAGFILSDSNVLADCKQVAMPETETEERQTKVLSLRFDDFWSAYPNCKRKGSKQKCLAKWIAQKLDTHADEIISHVRSMATSGDWTKQEGQFIPAPLSYITQARWDGAEPDNSSSDAQQVYF